MAEIRATVCVLLVGFCMSSVLGQELQTNSSSSAEVSTLPSSTFEDEVTTSPEPYISESEFIAVMSNDNNTKTAEPEYEGPVRKCSHKDDETLNACLRQVLEDLKPRLKTGIPEVNLPPLDPMRIPNLAFQQGNGPVKVIAVFSNVDVQGLSNFDKSDFWVHLKRRTLDFDIAVPQMQITGLYQLSGNLFFFPIGGNGNFWLNLAGIHAKGTGKLGLVLKAPKEKRVVLRKTEINLDIDSIKVHLTNLFHGDRLLGQVINNFINENAKDIFDEIKPQITGQVGEMVTLIANRALSTLSADHFADIEEEADAI